MVTLATALAFAAVACTDNSDDIAALEGEVSTLSEKVSALEAAAAAPAPPTPGFIDIQLQEWGVIPLNVEKKNGEFTVAAGTYVINTDNIGPVDPHELVIIRTDLAETDLLQDERGFVLEDGEGIDAFLGEIEEYDVGGSMAGIFKLTPGRYILFCNIVELEEGEWESHFNEGMRTVLIVE
ncbi:MAG: hypothetical protein F4Y98_01430 [Chloroflexi bacterium]|nr:hypothetical protein [Chloroflexota bacterium]